MLPIVPKESSKVAEKFCDKIKELLNSVVLNVIGNYIKTDKIALRIGRKSFGRSEKRRIR